MITPDLKEFSTLSFKKEQIERIINRGIEAARKQLNACIRIKTEFGLEKNKIASSDTDFQNTKIRLHGISIAGNTTLPYQFVTDLFELKMGEMCTQENIDSCVSHLFKTGYFKNEKYEIRPVGKNSVHLILKVKEKTVPKISKIYIRGNKKFPESLVRKMLNIEPGDLFDPDKLDEKITILYGLGYFETIYYEINPINEEEIQITFHIKEKMRRELNLGLRFDDYHKFIGSIRIQGMNILMPGIRSSMELQFGGYTTFTIGMYYLGQTLNLPVYPFFDFRFKEIEKSIYNLRGSPGGAFSDRSNRIRIGMGFLIKNLANVQVSYFQERMNVTSSPESSIALDFPSWKQKLSGVHANFTLDLLDDSGFPTKGIFIKATGEKNIESFSHFQDYFRFYFNGKYLQSFFNQSVILQFSAIFGRSSGSLPHYKYFFAGGPLEFAGVDYYQLTGNKIDIFNAEMKHMIIRNFFGSVFIGAARRKNKLLALQSDDHQYITAAGISVYYVSPVGPIHIVYAHRFNGIAEWPDEANYIFFTAGFDF